MKSIIKIIILSLSMVVFAVGANAQTKMNVSPFHHLPIPQKAGLFNATVSNSVTAYRFVLPFAGYSPFTKQISTGLGYGWNKMHFVDSTQTYYTDLAIFGAIFANGDITPSPYNFISVGVGIGVLNNLIMVVPSYNLPTSGNTSGAFDLKISFGLTFK